MTIPEASAEKRLVKRTKRQVGHRRVTKSKKTRTVSQSNGSSSSSSSSDSDDGSSVVGEILGAIFEGIFSSDDSDDDYEYEEGAVYDSGSAYDSEPIDGSVILFGGMGSSFRRIAGYEQKLIPALSYEFGLTLDAKAFAFDLVGGFDQPGALTDYEHSIFNASGTLRFSPTPDWFMRPSIGVGAGWFGDFGEASEDHNGMSLQLVAALHADIDEIWDVGLHYAYDIQMRPSTDPDAEDGQLEAMGGRNVVTLRVGIRF